MTNLSQHSLGALLVGVLTLLLTLPVAASPETVPSIEHVGIESAVVTRGEATRVFKPDMAISMGDSYISGEGAEDFLVGDGFDDYVGSFPGWSTADTQSYFCHRSKNSSIFVADLPDIEKRRSVSCSGGRPQDILNIPDSDRRTGRSAQVDYLRTAANNNDVDVILLGIGANTDEMTFGSILALCHVGFMYDAADWTGALAVAFVNALNPNSGGGDVSTADIQRIASQNGCERDDLPSDQVFDEIGDSVEDAIVGIIEVMDDEGYNDGEYKIVVQGYTNPFTDDIKNKLKHEKDGLGVKKYDTSNTFNRLAIERYEAGCPVHIKSMTTADTVADLLNDLQVEAVESVRLAYPDADVVHMDVRDAFDHDEKLCAKLSPDDALSNPIWFRDDTNQIQRVFPGSHWNFFPAYEGLASECGDGGHFARCQESGHPNEAGHQRLGECLAEVVDRDKTNRNVRCYRKLERSTIVQDL